MRLGANYQTALAQTGNGVVDAKGTTRAGLVGQPPPTRLPTGILTAAKGARSGAKITFAELQADPRYQAVHPLVQAGIDTDWNGVTGFAGMAGPWTPEEADAYLDALTANNPPGPNATPPVPVTVQQATAPASSAILVAKAASALPPVVAGSTAPTTVTLPPPPVPIPPTRFATAKPPGPLATALGPTVTPGRADIQTDPRWPALQQLLIGTVVENDIRNSPSVGWVDVPNAEEADAYIDAAIHDAQTNTHGYTDDSVRDAGRIAVAAMRVPISQVPLSGRLALSVRRPPTPPAPQPRLTDTHAATDGVSLAEFQADPRYQALSAVEQADADSDFTYYGSTGQSMLPIVTAQEADAYLDGITTTGKFTGSAMVNAIRSTYYVTNMPSAGGNPSIPIPTASVPFLTTLMNDPRRLASTFDSKSIGTMQSDLVMMERNKGALLTAGEIDAYLDGFYTANTPGNNTVAMMAAGRARLAEPGMPFDPALSPIVPNVSTAPTPSATPTAPAAPSPGQPVALPSSAVGLHNAWASDPRAAFLFVHPNSVVQQTANSPTPVPMSAPNNAYKRIVAAIDDAGPSLGLTQTADLDEATDIALSRYTKEWNDSVAAGNDPAQMGKAFGKWRYVARALALADVYQQMDLAKRQDVTIPPALATILASQYYVTAANRVRAQNLKAPLQRIGVPTGAPLGGPARQRARCPRCAQRSGRPRTAGQAGGRDPAPGTWPTPAHLLDLGDGTLEGLAGMAPARQGSGVDWTTHQARRAMWIGTGNDAATKNRRRLADAADRLMGHSGHSSIPGSSTSGGFEGIREAAHTMTGVMFPALNSQTYNAGSVSQLDYDDARVLMQAAAQAPEVPDIDGSGEHKMWRGLVLTKAKTDRLAVGDRLTEPLGQFTLNQDYARGYMDLRTTGAMRTGNRDQAVLIEVYDAHGVRSTPLNFSAQDDNHGLTDEVVASGQFEIIEITESDDPVVRLNPGGNGYQVTTSTQKVTHVKVKQVSPGWDFAGGQLTLVGAQAPVTPTGQNLPLGGSLSMPGSQFAATVGRNRRVITPPSQLAAPKKPKAKALIDQSSATSRNVTLPTSTHFDGAPHTLASVATGPGQEVTQMATRHLPPRGAMALPSTFPDVDEYWKLGGQVSPGVPTTVEVLDSLLTMSQSTPIMPDIEAVAQQFGIEAVGGKPTGEQVAFYSSFLKSYETGDDWNTALGKALDAVDQVVTVFNPEILTPARGRPSPVTDATDKQWITDIVAMNDLVGFAFMDQYLNNGGSPGRAGSANDAYARAGKAIDSLEVAGRINAQTAKDLRNKVGAGLPKPVQATATNLTPSGRQLATSTGGSNVFTDVSGLPIPPVIPFPNPRIAKASMGSRGGYTTPVATPWDPDLQTPYAISLGLPQDTTNLIQQFGMLEAAERSSISHFSGYGFPRGRWGSTSALSRLVDPQKVAEATAIVNAYIAARAQYGNAALSGSRLSAGRTLARKAQAAERTRTSNLVTLAKNAALAQRGAPKPPPVAVLPAKPGRPARRALRRAR